MSIFIVVLHIIVCFALILIVLLQTGKGADMGAAFGGSSQTVFGATGGVGFLGKLTTGAAVLFMLTSLTLAYFSGVKGGGGSSIMKETAVQEEVVDPAGAGGEGVSPEAPAADVSGGEGAEAETTEVAPEQGGSSAPSGGESTKESPE